MCGFWLSRIGAARRLARFVRHRTSREHGEERPNCLASTVGNPSAIVAAIILSWWAIQAARGWESNFLAGDEWKGVLALGLGAIG